MQRWLRFTLSGLLLVTLLVALVIRFWVVPIPEGLRSAEFTDADEMFAEYIWYDEATAEVEKSFNMDGSESWCPNNVESVTIELTISVATDFDIEDKTRVFELARVPVPK